MDQLSIKQVENSQLSHRTKMALLDLIRDEKNANQPFKLPNEGELSQRLGVSRNVLRDALMSLEEMGVVTRRRSKGTIASPQLACATGRLDTYPELLTMISDAGYPARSETVRMGYVFEKESAFENDDMYLNVEKLFFAGNIPVAYCIDHMPSSFTQGAGDDIMELRNLTHYEFLEKRCNTSLAYTMVNVNAVVPQPWLCELLKPNPEEAVLFLDDYAYNYDHAIIVHSHIYLRNNILQPKFLRKSW